ncbi:ATP-binding protein [Streptomyces cinereoruber]|uniref:ATP-binding protein n=1 Tax=Streptomyces cinereoruber TaxID=67260 RepID=UPI003C2F139B
MERETSVSAVFESGEDIAAARDLARDFLETLREKCGVTVSPRALGAVRLVVSELVTNARKYAPGPCLLTLGLHEGTVEVTVWDSSTTLPLTLPPDPTRVGQHGLEIVRAVCHGFEAHREPVGKRVRAVVTLADEPDGIAADRRTA